MHESVIYDLDGTLVDSRDDLADSVNAMLARLGLPARNPPVSSTASSGRSTMASRNCSGGLPMPAAC